MCTFAEHFFSPMFCMACRLAAASASLQSTGQVKLGLDAALVVGADWTTACRQIPRLGMAPDLPVDAPPISVEDTPNRTMIGPQFCSNQLSQFISHTPLADQAASCTVLLRLVSTSCSCNLQLCAVASECSGLKGICDQQLQPRGALFPQQKAPDEIVRPDRAALWCLPWHAALA